MKLPTPIIPRLGRLLGKLGDTIAKRGGFEGIWIDVGAHSGEATLTSAILNPGLKVYAFEPNLNAAVKLIGRSSNYIVIPMAVAERDGSADFYVNALSVASSLFPFNEGAVASWVGGEGLRVTSVLTVPTVRLDTFMELTGIRKVDFLKIDAQGADLNVVRSAGLRLNDVQKITLEVDIAPMRLYQGSASRADIVEYLEGCGFALTEAEAQSCGQEENLTFIRRRETVSQR